MVGSPYLLPGLMFVMILMWRKAYYQGLAFAVILPYVESAQTLVVLMFWTLFWTNFSFLLKMIGFHKVI